MSPFGNAALLLESDTADALKVLSYDPNNATTPFTVGAEVAYTGPKTSLPNIVLGIDRGTLKGRVFVSEVEGVRQLEFAPAGTVTDLGRIEFSGVPGMVGAIGVQP